MKKISVALVESSSIFREALQNFLNSHKNIDVNFTTDNTVTLLQVLDKSKVDRVILEIKRPAEDCFIALRELSESYPKLKIIAFSSLMDSQTVNRALSLGAHKFVPKHNPENLLKALLE